MRALFQLPLRRAVRREVDEELEFHLQMRTQQLVDRGWSPPAARVEAEREFGDLADARAYCHQADLRRETRLMRTEALADLRHDLVFAVRALRRAPLFTLVAIATLALGIGANTAIFSVVRGVLLRALPFGDPERMALVLTTYQGRQFPYTSPANLVDWQRENTSFTGLTMYTSRSAVLTGAGQPETTYSEGFANFHAEYVLPSGAWDFEFNDWRNYPGGAIRQDVEGAVAGYFLDLVDPIRVSLPFENDPVQFPATWLASVIDSCQEGAYYWYGVGLVSAATWSYPDHPLGFASCFEDRPATTTQPPVLPAYAWGYRKLPPVPNPSGWSQVLLNGLRQWNLEGLGR